MAYANAQSSKRRIATLASVAAIQLLAGYGLVIGLDHDLIPRVDEIFIGINIPPPLPEPTPSPEPKDQKRGPLTQPRDPGPIPLESPLPLPFPPGPTTFDGDLTSGSGGGETIGEASFPSEPLPPAFPLHSAKPRGNTAKWVTNNDYPSNDIRLNHEGQTKVRLTVSATGRVTRCEVTASSGWPGLDQAACAKLTDRARFDPASDHTGAKVEGSYATSVHWRIPED